MKKVIAICLTVIICLSFSSCDFSINTVDTLMRPPKLSGESNLLQRAFEESIENAENVIMKNPISGNNRSSFLFYDLDNDGVQEGFAFYSDPSTSDIAHVSIFEQINDDWNMVANIKGHGEEIYEFDFADINGDNVLEIIVSWTFLSDADKKNISFSNFNDRVLTIYQYTGDSANLLKTEYFTKMFVDDFNKDNCDEILLLNINHANVEYRTTARLLSFDSEYVIKNDINLVLSNMLSIYNIVMDSANGHTRIFIDGSINENTLITEVIDINQKDFSIILPLYESNISDKPLTVRSTQIFSSDIDDDGVIEIPTYENISNSFNVSSSLKEPMLLPLTVWSEIVDDTLSVDFKCIYNASYNYFYVIPSEWENKVYITYNLDNTVLTFNETTLDGAMGNEIISFKVFNINEWKEYSGKYSKLNENGVFVYSYFLDHDFEYSESLLENFIIVN